MQSLLSLLFVFTLFMSLAQRPARVRPMLNFQYEKLYSSGIGLEYGNHIKRKFNVPWKYKGRHVIYHNKYGFCGARGTFNKLLYTSGYKVEISFLTSNVFSVGLSAAYNRIEEKNCYLIKPMIGLSHFNISLLYGYNFFVHSERLVNSSNISLFYSIRLK